MDLKTVKEWDPKNTFYLVTSGDQNSNPYYSYSFYQHHRHLNEYTN